MKKLLLLAVTFTAVTFTTVKANEPEKIKAKDLMEKVDRSDVQIDSDSEGIKVDNIMTEIKIPTLDIEKPKKSKQVKTKSKNNRAHKKPVVKSKPTRIKKEPVKIIKKKPIEFREALALNQLKRNDKIVVSTNKTYVSRKVNSKVLRFNFDHELPVKSKGLKMIRTNFYQIVNKDRFVKDIKALEGGVETKKPVSSPSKKQNKVDESTNKPPANSILAKRHEVEAKLNRGKVIKKELQLKNIKSNDDIYLFGEVQLLIRKKGSTSGNNKYWLVGKIDTTNKSLVKITNNHYKSKGKYTVN